MAAIATVSVTLPSSPDTTAAAIRISTIVLEICSQNILNGDLPPRSLNSFGPYSASRRAASPASRPESSAAPVCRTTSDSSGCASER